jgi:hypothetical protein
MDTPAHINPLTPELNKSLRATLPDEIFYWGFCVLNLHFVNIYL